MKNKQKDSKAWQALARHQAEIATQSMRDWFAADARRFDKFHLSAGEMLLDYSRNLIQAQTISLLCELAHTSHLRQKIEALFTGQPVNPSEKRPALHTALRDPKPHDIVVNGEHIAPLIEKSLAHMRDFVTAIRNGTWTGATGKSITHVVNIGIGGSHTGPCLCAHALKTFADNRLTISFISSIDDAQLTEVLQTIPPEFTLFIISSKSFSTIETLTNAKTILTFMQDKFGEAAQKHFVAVTAAPTKARAFGIPEAQIFSLWEWVGGRYSIWSAIGLPLMLMIGITHFEDFLRGAHEMDLHFRQREFEKNMPVLLGLLGIWYMNFFDARVQAIIPYVHRLRHLIPWLQQAEMESNGKHVNLNGDFVHYATAPVLFGEEGIHGQHTFHQLLHQGNHFIPVDFIMTGQPHPDANQIHQDILTASCLSQAQALMRGKTWEEAFQNLRQHYSEEEAAKLASHQVIPGNKPSNILFMQRLTPKNLGALLALYEHKIFVQSVIWDINPFDQWGVELGKQLLPTILQGMQDDTSRATLDPATASLIDFFQQSRRKS